MNSIGFTILETRHVPDTRNTEITVGTPDMRQVTVTIPDNMVGSAMAEEVIRRALNVRRESIDSLDPVDE
jgi:hypothetical protein